MYYHIQKKDLENKEISCLNIIKPYDRSTIKAYLTPTNNKQTLQKFKDKFFNPKGQSSQLYGAKAILVNDASRNIPLAQKVFEPKPRSWKFN